MESIIRYIIERQAINFGEANSNEGQCIILAGGPGSGKGFVQSRVLANFKSIDVDYMKELYIKFAKKHYGDDRVYDLTNSKDVADLHEKVRELGWKKLQRKHFINAHAKDKAKGAKLPNICWDMVSDELTDITAVSYAAKEMGYKVTLIWVVCNVETAKEGNANRARRVPEKLLIEKHKAVRNLIPKVLKGEGEKYKAACDSIDYAWVGLSAGYHRKLDDKMEFDTNNNKRSGNTQKETFANNRMIKFHKMEKKDGVGPFDYAKYESMINKFLDMQQPEMTPEEIEKDKKQHSHQSSYKNWEKDIAKELSSNPDVSKD